jgi:hypothetical protein
LHRPDGDVTDGKLASEAVDDILCTVISTVGVHHDCGNSLACPAWPCCHRVEGLRWKNEIEKLSKLIAEIQMEENADMEVGDGWNADDISEMIRNLELIDYKEPDSKVYENALMETDAEIVDRMLVMKLSDEVGSVVANDNPKLENVCVDIVNDVSPVQKIISKFEEMNTEDDKNEVPETKLGTDGWKSSNAVRKLISKFEENDVEMIENIPVGKSQKKKVWGKLQNGLFGWKSQPKHTNKSSSMKPTKSGKVVKRNSASNATNLMSKWLLTAGGGVEGGVRGESEKNFTQISAKNIQTFTNKEGFGPSGIQAEVIHPGGGN